MTGLRESDRETRQEIIAATGRSMLVEAAAGTGKTTLIVERILRGVRDGTLRLPTTVAITFTEKAAGELESRIRARLSAELQAAETPQAERARLRAAVEELDRANIGTIHAFCARLLREKAAEAGVDPEFGVLEETQARLLRERCWREWMEGQVAACPEPLVEALRAGVGVERLKQAALALAQAPQLLEQERYRVPLPDQESGKLIAAFREHGRRAGRVLDAHLGARRNDHSRALRRVSGELAASEADDLPRLRLLACEAAAVDPEQAARSIARDARDEAGAAFGPMVEAARGVAAYLARDLFAWAGGYVAAYAREKASRSVLDFQDLLLLAARLLRDRPATRRYFGRRFGAFFVDEFQDTDPLQAEIIAYLCEAPAEAPAARMGGVRLQDGKLFAVGDPQQSIYRFRGADVQVYDEFTELFGPPALPDERVRRIRCNFRSRPELIGWLNRLFARLFEPPRREGVYQAEHVPLEPPIGAPPAGGPTVMALCPPPKLETEGWKIGEARRFEAHFIARAIREALAGRLPAGPEPLTYRSFALLLRALTDVTTYEDALERYDIPYRVVGGKHFYQREQVAETLTLLRAVDDPLDEAAVVGALRSTFFGFSDEELFRYRQDGGAWNYLRATERPGPVGQAMALLERWHRRRNRVPAAVLLHEIFDRTKAPEAFLLKPAGEQRVANLEKLAGQLRALGAAAGNFGAVVRHLGAIREAELPEEESSAMEPGEQYVRIMSMHKAKGLQFEAVVLADLARQFAGEHQVGPVVHERRAGLVGLRVDGGISSEGFERLQEREFANQRAEERRLLYVACTRARRLLVLPLHWHEQRRDCFQNLLDGTGLIAGAGQEPPGEERDGVHYPDTGAWAGAVRVAPEPHAAAEATEEAAGELLARRERWLAEHARLAARASAGERFVLPSAMEAEPAPRHLAAEGAPEHGGRQFGSLFHEVIAGLPVDAPPDEELARGLARLAADAFGLDEEAAREAAGLAATALAAPEFRALVDGADELLREASFAVPLARLCVCPDDAGGLLEGSIDLLVRRGEATVVLDYKTDRFEAAGGAAVEERYWPQLALYGLAARACGLAGRELELALYFVRAGRISRRPLDEGLLADVGELLRAGEAD